jgi:hypothetical protein
MSIPDQELVRALDDLYGMAHRVTDARWEQYNKSWEASYGAEPTLPEECCQLTRERTVKDRAGETACWTRHIVRDLPVSSLLSLARVV